jgi:hypothetical protein
VGGDPLAQLVVGQRLEDRGRAEPRATCRDEAGDPLQRGREVADLVEAGGDQRHQSRSYGLRQLHKV